MAPARIRARVEGVVQGVGFRPHAHRLAAEHSLSGWARNAGGGVLLEVEGEPGALASFMSALERRAPALAVIENVETQTLPASGGAGFRILDSEQGGGAAAVSVDVAPCEQCLSELRDPADRRHRYPFINCTGCGPRMTIIRGLPYDRERTSMAAFAMCGPCAREFHDPASRRFHAQPNACPDCGPRLELRTPDGARAGAGDPLGEAAAALAAGRILAVKGLGGYNLACRADDERAVAELRRRKHREQKPFALMTADIDSARRLVELTAAEERLLGGLERPILIAPRRPEAGAAPSVAPRSRELGVMLPSTPLHHLLAQECGCDLVMTSGNLAGEPMAHLDEDALVRLGTIAELILSHDRPIELRLDDSVLRAAGPGPIVMRRARGYVPRTLALPAQSPPLLACGAELKATFCLARGMRAWVGPHIGDLRDYDTFISYREQLAHMEGLLSLRPELIVHDLHPDYLSSGLARERDGVRLLGVQHHHAHMAGCLAEHGELGEAVGAIYDGSGLGSDGTQWGGELLVGGIAAVRRAGHLRATALPGGDAAAIEPWRMACSWLLQAGEGEQPPSALAGMVDGERWAALARIARAGVSSPPSTSVGRLFDAVAAICGLRASSHEEGLAAMELEAGSDGSERGAYELAVIEAEVLELDPRELIRSAAADIAAGRPVGLVGARFHNGLAAATVAALSRLAEREGTRTAVLSGGVFANRLLLERCREGLEAAGLRVLFPRSLPPGDGGISYGQAAVAALTWRSGAIE